MIYSVNDCSVDTDTFEVRRQGRVVPVEPQVFDLLVLLLENRDRVVTKDEMIEKIWNGRIVSEAALSSRIKAVRQAIGDDGESQAWLRTVRRRGFRLVAAPREETGAPEADLDRMDEAVAPTPAPLAESKLRRRNWVALAAGCLALVAALGSGWLALRPTPATTPTVATAALGMPRGPGIAVLPLAVQSNDRGLEFFANAITDEIIANLTRFSELRVTARTATRELGGTANDMREIGKRLGVDYVVAGSLQQSMGRLRVSARLVNAAESRVIWAESYERELSPADLFAIQDSIATNVVASVASISGGVIAREALTMTRAKPPRELSAYECTARANELMLTGFSAPAHLAIRDCLEATLAREPDYAGAWAILAWVHSLEFSEGHNRRSDGDPRDRALAAGRRAIELAPNNPLARFGMARATYLARDLDLFRSEANQALALNPHDPLLLGNLGNWLAFSGRWDEGIPMVTKAIALSHKTYPRWWHAAIAKDHFRRGDYDAALVEFKRMNLPNWWWNQVELAYTYGQLGDLANARKAVERLEELYPGFDLEKAVMEHRKFSFEPSYIERVLDGLRKAGVPERTGTPNKG